MFLNVKEMTLLCAFYDGTVSKTIDLLSKAKDGRPDVMAMITNVRVKMESMQADEVIALSFDTEP